MLRSNVAQGTEIGADFARALAAKDPNRLLELMHPEIDFRGLTLNRNWEATGRDAMISVLLGLRGPRSRWLPLQRDQPGRAFPGRAAGVSLGPRRADRVDARPVLGIS
jgi:hypothetical protein